MADITFVCMYIYMNTWSHLLLQTENSLLILYYTYLFLLLRNDYCILRYITHVTYMQVIYITCTIYIYI